MSLLILRDVELAFGSDPLLERVNARIDAGERVCLLGRNGAGKSSLLKLAAGELRPDAGEVLVDPATRVAGLPQDVPADLRGSVRDVVCAGLPDAAALLDEHQRLSGGNDLRALEAVQQRIEAAGAWDLDRRVERTLTRLSLDAGADFTTLSGGLKRRALLARSLVAEPDLLLLDEPTNHLDVAAIEWLEELVRGWRGAVLFTTHDRRLLERVATGILELDRGRLTAWPGDYAGYLRRRQEREHAETRARAGFDRKLAGEEAWIRQGIRARRTRNEGRVRRLEEMRRERARRRSKPGRARFAIAGAGRSGRKVLEASAARAGHGASTVIRELDLLVERGDRVGIVGPNGCGKTTLINLLIGRIPARGGEVVAGTNLQVAYFDQHRAALDPARSVADSVADGAEFVTVDGARRHIIGYLADFLFNADRARSPVASLSGGERARLLLARLFATPCNLLVMDEPTNDLDLETLELLEERLLQFPGTLLLVSHDRAFLDNVVTSILAIDDGGRVREHVGGYSDWLRQRPARDEGALPAVPRPAPSPPRHEPRARTKLSYREQRELESLPERIEALETRIACLQSRLADPAFYRDGGNAVAATRGELDGAELELEACYERWSELEDPAG